MRYMTILWIYNMPLEPEAGGTERITSLVAKGLSERGHKCLDILVLTEDGSMTYKGNPLSDLYMFLKEKEVDVVINQIAYAKWLLSEFLSRGGARWHAEGGRIISCLHFDPCNPSYIHLLRSYEHLSLKQYVSLIRQYMLKPYYRNKQQQSEGEIYNYIYENSDMMISLSETHFPYLKKVMQRNEYMKLHAIGNMLTFPYVAETEILKTKSKTVMVCARMSEYHKRITLILKAWELVKRCPIAGDWVLKIIGDGHDLPRYKRMVMKRGIVDIEFLGQQSPKSFYENGAILLMASSAEGWGLAITEGLQNGVVPVVMDSSPVYSDIIQNGYNGILTPDNDVKAFAKAVIWLISDDEQRRKMQINALESAMRFTSEKTIEKWSEALSLL
ncbi:MULTISPECIES: glycosyltransferase [Bacteroidales]|nr:MULTISPECIES: glycosyltransferase [Bacteroidales]ROT17603.1 glycosyltransferase [Muribaculaceae bacterium Isolate-110 (HZI)]